jgi:hypothetical protein
VKEDKPISPQEKELQKWGIEMGEGDKVGELINGPGE